MSRSPALRPLREVNSEAAEPMLIRLVWFLNVFFKRLTNRDWRDAGKIPRTGGLVIAANHISNIDPISLGQFSAYAGRWPRYLGKASLFSLPVIGWVITRCEQIPVERNSRHAAQALGQAMAAVNQGKSIIIYPEGTITADPDLWPMAGKSGAARIALATGCPVVPVGQWGSQYLMPGKKASFPRFFPRKTMAFKAGDPVPLDDLRGQPPTSAVLREATNRIMDAITDLVAELRQEEPPVRRLDASQPPEGRPGQTDDQL